VPDSPDPSGSSDDGGEEKGSVERPVAPRHRKPTVDEVFGDVLPDTTRDERDVVRPSGRHTRDDDILRDVPPHHGTH
jgi:hypothetical protein